MKAVLQMFTEVDTQGKAKELLEWLGRYVERQEQCTCAGAPLL